MVQAEAEQRRLAEEQRHQAEVERERQHMLAAQDSELAEQAVSHLRAIRPGLLQSSMTSLSHPQADGHSIPAWRTVPEVMLPPESLSGCVLTALAHPE